MVRGRLGLGCCKDETEPVDPYDVCICGTLYGFEASDLPVENFPLNNMQDCASLLGCNSLTGTLSLTADLLTVILDCDGDVYELQIQPLENACAARVINFPNDARLPVRLCCGSATGQTCGGTIQCVSSGCPPFTGSITNSACSLSFPDGATGTNFELSTFVASNGPYGFVSQTNSQRTSPSFRYESTWTFDGWAGVWSPLGPDGKVGVTGVKHRASAFGSECSSDIFPQVDEISPDFVLTEIRIGAASFPVASIESKFVLEFAPESAPSPAAISSTDSR